MNTLCNNFHVKWRQIPGKQKKIPIFDSLSVVGCQTLTQYTYIFLLRNTYLLSKIKCFALLFAVPSQKKMKTLKKKTYQNQCPSDVLIFGPVHPVRSKRGLRYCNRCYLQPLPLAFSSVPLTLSHMQRHHRCHRRWLHSCKQDTFLLKQWAGSLGIRQPRKWVCTGWDKGDFKWRLFAIAL